MKLGKIGLTALLLFFSVAPFVTNATTVNADVSKLNTIPGIVTGTMGVYNEQGSYVPMVWFDENDVAQPVTNRALQNDTPWQVDKMVFYGNDTYYRVSTNEWVAYRYVNDDKILFLDN
ncbi:hypothetical protein [Companilactobacillus keshanensis]|uniref:Surface layer protein A domain-containing protein n=1 Tax=Companilactobacillus keshanensis TaxID=2486003 RepID=A0ABW4BRP0_9LACO|nr:hypothetical protein [Companilactobacillus keshanensis]